MLFSVHPLSSIVGVLAIINNIFILSAPWIASPTKPQNGQTALPGLSPFIAAITYAVWQPICLIFFMWIGFPVWISVVAICPSHVLMSQIITIYWFPKTARKSLEQSAEAKTAIVRYHINQNSLLDHVKRLGKSENYVWILPVQSAAASDAALVLFAADLTSYPEEYSGASSRVSYYFAFFALAIYFAARYVDYLIATTVHRRGIFAFDSYTWRERLTLLGLLACVFIVRAGFASLLEQFWDFPLVSLVLWPRNVEIVLDRSNAEWIAHSAQQLPWLSPTLSFLTPPMQFAAVYFLRRAARED